MDRIALIGFGEAGAALAAGAEGRGRATAYAHDGLGAKLDQVLSRRKDRVA